jgi:tRNA (guanosine-2'-O-)-methyltransferase
MWASGPPGRACYPGGVNDRDSLLQRLPPELHDLAQCITTRRLARLLNVLDVRIGGLAMVAEAVNRRHNVSAILRSAEAFGLHEAHLVCNDFQPVRSAAKGASRWMALSLHDTTADCVSVLKARNFAIYVCDLADDAMAPEQVPVDRPLAVLFGGEVSGVSDQAHELADGVIKLPMVGVTQSLNVSVAAAIILQIIARRRAAQVGHGSLGQSQRTEFLARFLKNEAKRKKAWRYLVADAQGDFTR